MCATFLRFSDFDSFSTSLVRSCKRTYFVVHGNIRSLRKCWYEFLVLLNTIESTMDVIVLAELNICDADTQNVPMSGYICVFYTRPEGRDGGIAVFEKQL